MKCIIAKTCPHFLPCPDGQGTDSIRDVFLMNEPLTGTLTIKAAAGNGIILELRDDASRTTFLRVELRDFELTRAMQGEPQKVLLDPQHLERLGSQMQTKVEHVKRPKLLKGRHTLKPRQWMAAMEKFEVDGWVGSFGDCIDPRRGVFDDAQAVTFTRYVKSEDIKPCRKA